jgi:hypothetical protein
MNYKSANKRLLSPEEALFEYAKSLKRHTKGRLAVLVRFATLTKYYQQPHHQRMATGEFSPLLQRFEGQMFTLSNSDVLCVLNGARVADLDDAVLRIRYMVRDDENLKAMEAQSEDDILCRWFDIEKDYETFLKFARRRFETGVDEPEFTPQIKAADQDAGKPTDPTKQGSDDDSIILTVRPGVVYKPITAPGRKGSQRDLSIADLDKLMKATASADLEPYLQRRQVRLVAGALEPRPVLNERFVPTGALLDALMPNCRAIVDPLLSRRLRETIDSRTLAAIASIDDSGALATCLKTSVATISSKTFQEFDRRCAPKGGHRIVLEFSLIDILMDPVAYLNARAELRGKGYRVMISDMDPFAFISINRAELPADFEKVRWVKEFADYRHARPQEMFSQMVEEAGNHRVILASCNDSEAFDFGQSAGVNLFSGTYIDDI